jgi:hypothetical protein
LPRKKKKKRQSPIVRAAKWVASNALKHVVDAGKVALPPGALALWRQYSVWARAQPPGYYFAAGAIASIVIAYLIWRDAAERFLYSALVGRHSGISRVYAVLPYGGDPLEADVEARELAEQSIKDLVQDSSKVQLLLASGFHYIGWRENPGLLYDVLSKKVDTGFRLEVLIQDPNYTGPRARDFALEEHEYKEGVQAVLSTLGRWRKDGMSIEVRLYGDEPIWQMVLDEEEMWLLCARNTRSECSPIYCIRRDAKYGLHYGLYGVWERRWRLGKAIPLTNIAEPDKNKIRDVRQPVAVMKVDEEEGEE